MRQTRDVDVRIKGDAAQLSAATFTVRMNDVNDTLLVETRVRLLGPVVTVQHEGSKVVFTLLLASESGEDGFVRHVVKTLVQLIRALL